MSSPLTTLSIFILLLAFFIVLNALSSFETSKVAPVISSINKTFGTKQTDRVFQGPSLRSDPQEGAGEGMMVLEELEGLFRARIQSVQAARSDSDGTLLLRLSLEELDVILDEKKALARSLYSMMKTGEDGRQYDLTLLGNMPAHKELFNPEGEELVRRLSRIVGELEKNGVPGFLLSLGLQEGPRGTVELMFKPHQRFSKTTTPVLQ